jgi:hypothetical protein
MNKLASFTRTAWLTRPLALPVLANLLALSLQGAVPDPAALERLTGLKGTMNTNEGVFKVTAPRTDLKISVDGWTMPPFMGLTSWAAFSEGKQAEAMVMGDLVLFRDEVNPVMSALLDNGISVTALHNHFFYDEPKVYFMHLAGEGSFENLATGVRKAFDALKVIRAADPQPAAKFRGAAMPAQSAITGKAIEDILGIKGQGKDGMFKVLIGRKAKMACGCEIAKDMGVNTWAAFAGTDENALVDGDFAMTEEELQPVLKSLRAGGVNIVAIHNHMTGETPRFIFLHYWGRGKADELAKALKAGLATQKE